MTPAMFAKAKAVIESSPDVLSHGESGPQSGSFATSAVGMSYAYDGTTLCLVVTAKHGLAKFASEDTIKGRLMDLLSEVRGQDSRQEEEYMGNMKRATIGLFAGALLLACAGCGLFKPATGSTAATPQTPYQQAATVMQDFSTDLVSAQQMVVSLHSGGVIDDATYKTVQAAFGQIATYGPQIDALISAQAAAPTIMAKVNAALGSVNSIVATTGALDANTAAQVKGGIQALGLLLGQLNTIFPVAVTSLPAPQPVSEVNHGPAYYRSAGRAGSNARHPDLSTDRGPGERGWDTREAAFRDPRSGRRQLRPGAGRFEAVAA
jgi:hypothetical protein